MSDVGVSEIDQKVGEEDSDSKFNVARDGCGWKTEGVSECIADEEAGQVGTIGEAKFERTSVGDGEKNGDCWRYWSVRKIGRDHIHDD